MLRKLLIPAQSFVLWGAPVWPLYPFSLTPVQPVLLAPEGILQSGPNNSHASQFRAGTLLLGFTVPGVDSGQKSFLSNKH